MSDEDLISVDESGAITALSLGSAVLTMTADEYSRAVQISVIPKVTAINNVDKTVDLITGDSQTLSPKLSPAEFSDEKITYTIQDPSVASVTDAGTVTALAAGDTMLVIEAGGCSLMVPVSVTEPAPPAPVYTGGSSYSGSGSSSSSGNKRSGSSSSGNKSQSSNDDKGYFLDSDKEHF